MKGSPLEAMLATGGRDHPDALLLEASSLERKLLALLEANGTDGEEYNSLRRKVRKHYAQLILWHHEFAQAHDIETALWKNVYYKQLEILRRRLRTTQNAFHSNNRQNEVADQLKKDAVAFLNLLDSANYFYKELMKQLQKQHGSVGAVGHPNAKPLPTQHTPSQNLLQHGPKQVVDIHATCGRILTILGDLTRYRGEVSQKLAAGVESASPEWFYEQAASVWPEGGQPLNQLAVMALHKRKHLQSAYYYARALSSKQHFPQAHGNLVQLWEKNQRACNQLAEDAGEPIGHSRHLSMAMEGLALRFEKVMMMVYEGKGGSDFQPGVEDVIADLVSVIRAPEFFKECKHCSPASNQMLHITILVIFGVYSTSSSFPGNLAGLRASRGEGQMSQKNAYGLFLQLASILVSAVGHSSYGQDVSPLLSGPVFVILSWMAQHVGEIASESENNLQAGFWSAAADMAALLRSRGAAPPPLTENQRPIPEELELRGFLPLNNCFKGVDFQQQPWEGELLDAACRSKLWSKCCNLAQMLRDLLHTPNRDQQVLLAMKRFIAAVLQYPTSSGACWGPEHLELSDLAGVVPISPKFKRPAPPLTPVAEILTETSASQSLKIDTGSTAYHSVSNEPTSGMGSGLVMEDEDIEGEIVMYQASLDQASSECEQVCQSVVVKNPISLGYPMEGPPEAHMPERPVQLEKSKQSKSYYSEHKVEEPQHRDEDLQARDADALERREKLEGMSGQDGEKEVSQSEMGIPSRGAVGSGMGVVSGKGSLAANGRASEPWSSVCQADASLDDTQKADRQVISHLHPSGKVKESRFRLAPSPIPGNSEGRVSELAQEHAGNCTDPSAPARKAPGASATGRTLSCPSIDIADTAADVLNDVFPVNQEDLINQLRRLDCGKGPASEVDLHPAESITAPMRDSLTDLQPSAGYASSTAGAMLPPQLPLGGQHSSQFHLAGTPQCSPSCISKVPHTDGGSLVAPSSLEPVAESCTGRDELISHLSKLYMDRGNSGTPTGLEPVFNPNEVLHQATLPPGPPGFGSGYPGLLQSAVAPQSGTERQKPLLQVPLQPQKRQQNFAFLTGNPGYVQVPLLSMETGQISTVSPFGMSTQSLLCGLAIGPLGRDLSVPSPMASNILSGAPHGGLPIGLGMGHAAPGAVLSGGQAPMLGVGHCHSSGDLPPGIEQGGQHFHPGLGQAPATRVAPSQGLMSFAPPNGAALSTTVGGALPLHSHLEAVGDGTSDPALHATAPFSRDWKVA